MLVAFVSNTIVWCYSVGVLYEVGWERREAPSSCSPALHRGTKCILIQSFQLVVLTPYVLKAASIVHWHVMSYAENYSWKLGKGCCSTATPSTISSFGFNNVRYVVFTTSRCWSMVLGIQCALDDVGCWSCYELSRETRTWIWNLSQKYQNTI